MADDALEEEKASQKRSHDEFTEQDDGKSKAPTMGTRASIATQ